MAKREPKMKQFVTDKDGKEVEIETTSKGWGKNDCHGMPASMAGWAEGKASHHGINLGVAIACKDIEFDIDGEKVSAYIGDFETENKDGTTGKMAVYDPQVLNAVILDAFVEKYDLKVEKIKIAGNRTGAKKELESTYSDLSNNPEVMAVLKTTNPELYKKLNGGDESSIPPTEEVSENADTKAENETSDEVTEEITE